MTYSNDQEVILDGNIYFLQYAVFTKEDVMKEVTKKLDNYFVITEDNKYYVYLGAYTSFSNALKYQKILEENGIYTYLKNDYLNNGKEDDIKKLDKEILKENDPKKMREINNQIIEIFKS